MNIRRRFKPGRWGCWMVVIIGGLGVLLSRGSAYQSQIASRMMIAACMAAGLDLCVGIAGQLSLGHAVFMAAGAYTCAVATASGLGIWMSLILAVLIGAGGAFILGYAMMSLRGDYLAVATLGLGEIVRVALENTSSLGGAAGFYNIPRFTTPPFTWLLMLLCLVCAVVFKQSRPGFLASAVGQDEEASMAIGINTRHAKVIALMVGATFTALAGVLYSGLNGFISPRDFTFTRSIDMLAAVVLGGPGTIFGPMLAAMLMECFFAVFQTLSVVRMILYSLALIVVTIIRYKKWRATS